LHVAPDVHLAALWIRRSGKRYQPEHPGADAFRDRFDGAAFSSPIASYKHHDHAKAFGLHPIPKRAELDLQFAKFLVVLLPGEFLRIAILIAVPVFFHNCRDRASPGKRRSSEDKIQAGKW